MDSENNHPNSPYYHSRDAELNIEAIDVIEAFKLDFHLGNAVKYILRAGYKGVDTDEKRDIRKAISYLKRKYNLLDGKREW